MKYSINSRSGGWGWKFLFVGFLLSLFSAVFAVREVRRRATFEQLLQRLLNQLGSSELEEEGEARVSVDTGSLKPRRIKHTTVWGNGVRSVLLSVVSLPCTVILTVLSVLTYFGLRSE